MSTIRTLSTIRTQVSKSSPTIAAIVAAAFPGWKGRKVTVVEARELWSHTRYLGDATEIVMIDMTTLGAHEVPRPTIFEPVQKIPRHAHTFVVIHSRFQGKDCGVEIVVPALDIEMEIAADAVLDGAKPARIAAAIQSSSSFGYVSTHVLGVLVAIVQARAKARDRAERIAA